MKRKERRSDCPINFALQTFGDPWSLLVIRDLMFTEARTYGAFLAAGEGIATNILAARLRHLQEVGLIRRRGSEFALTQKGLDLLPAMLDLVAWSAQYDKRTAAPKAFVARINKDRAGVLAEMNQRLRRAYEL
ncbi:MAG: helix-turn-helix domain-containing protein [Gemmatimonadaceae bacterium]